MSEIIEKVFECVCGKCGHKTPIRIYTCSLPKAEPMAVVEEQKTSMKRRGPDKMLSAELRAQMAADYASGMSTRALGEKYGISFTTVQNYLVSDGVEIRHKRKK